MNGRKVKVLVIDDEEAYTSLLLMNLKQIGGYEVYCENDPSRAVEAALDCSPDVILLDIVMPGADGGDVASALRQHARLRGIPLLYVTAVVSSGETGGKVIKKESGEQMLAKPFKLETLCDWIEEEVASSLRTD